MFTQRPQWEMSRGQGSRYVKYVDLGFGFGNNMHYADKNRFQKDKTKQNQTKTSIQPQKVKSTEMFSIGLGLYFKN